MEDHETRDCHVTPDSRSFRSRSRVPCTDGDGREEADEDGCVNDMGVLFSSELRPGEDCRGVGRWIATSVRVVRIRNRILLIIYYKRWFLATTSLCYGSVLYYTEACHASGDEGNTWGMENGEWREDSVDCLKVGNLNRRGGLVFMWERSTSISGLLLLVVIQVHCGSCLQCTALPSAVA